MARDSVVDDLINKNTAKIPRNGEAPRVPRRNALPITAIVVDSLLDSEYRPSRAWLRRHAAESGEDGAPERNEPILEAMYRRAYLVFRSDGYGRAIGGDDRLPRKFLPIDELERAILAVPLPAAMRSRRFSNLWMSARDLGLTLEADADGYQIRDGAGRIVGRGGDLEEISKQIGAFEKAVMAARFAARAAQELVHVAEVRA